jgi:hypothetical protein
MAIKYIKAEEAPGSSVKYFDDKGKIWQFVGGTRTWRNQNPGNMVVGDYSRNNGMIGKAGGFAVFPDYETGHNALLILLIKKYGNFDLVKLMEKFAPPHENKTKRYIKFITKQTGVKESVKIQNYSKSEFAKLWVAIERFEGWKIGTIREYSTKGQITKVKKDKRGKITAYLVDGFGWIMKKEAIELTNLKKVDAVVVKRGRSIFLRSRPNNLESDNLDNKA